MPDTQAHIGQIHSVSLPRDAVHVAVVQVTAGEDLHRGDHITKDGVKGVPEIGIVDPFIDRPIKKGEAFYLFLYPGSAEDLTHQYVHPVLDADHPKIKARKVVMDWIESWNHWGDVDSRSLYQDALHQYKNEEKFSFGGRWRNEHDYEDEEFALYMAPIYDALEVLTGRKATQTEREMYYSCCV